ncbi:MAG: hypothetical protein KIT43_11610 [Bauldia sp.]|nr:hypothetical protein [Bauldia sp.]
MQRFWTIAFAVLLVAFAAVGLEYLAGGNSLYALLLAPLVLVRSIFWRVGLMRVLTIIVVALIPLVLRRRARIAFVRWLRGFRQRVAGLWAKVKWGWSVAPVWLTTFLGLLLAVVFVAAMILSGSILWILALVPFLAKSTLGFTAIRWLAHTAAGNGLKQLAPFLFTLLPRPVRTWLHARYRHLWWWTMRRIVKNRRRVEQEWRKRRRKAVAPAPVPIAESAALNPPDQP